MIPRDGAISPKQMSNRKHFRMDRDIVLKFLNEFNNDSRISDIQIDQEDGSFLVSYLYDPFTEKDECEERRDYGFDYNHEILVHPIVLVDFINILDDDPSVCDILVTQPNGRLLVVYYYGSNKTE